MPTKNNRCCVDGCDKLVGPKGAKGMCPHHYYLLAKGKCKIKDCQKPAKTLGYCCAHYHRLRRYGDPLYEPKRISKWNDCICEAEGCNLPVRVAGLCQKHYDRKRNGTLEHPHHYADGITIRNSVEYHVYKGMKRRCYNTKDKAYKNYGGRGIKVCDRWMGPNGFRNFLDDMGRRPNGAYPSGVPMYSIDRIDVNSDYCPENCRWATAKQQALNRRAKKASISI